MKWKIRLLKDALSERVTRCKSGSKWLHEGGQRWKRGRRKGAHRWGAVDPVDMFNELNWFMGLAYILSTVSLSHTFTDTVRWIIVPCLIYRAENTLTLRRARLQPPFKTFSVNLTVFTCANEKKGEIEKCKTRSVQSTILSMNHSPISVWSTPGDKANKHPPDLSSSSI